MFSKACEYGIKAIIYVATQSLEGKRAKIPDVARHTGTPEPFTAKILGLLVKRNILDSQKGPYGGFEINPKRMSEITLNDIVQALDGETLYTGCALGLGECDAEHPCPMHEKFSVIRKGVEDMLQNTTIYELATQLKSGKTILLR